jgi:hypothetical protein
MWHYAQDGQRKGPVSDDDLRRMAAEGSLKPSDLVWREGMSDWLPASEATGFQFGSPAAPAAPSAPPTYAQQPPSYAQQSSPYAPPAASLDMGPPIPDYLPWSIAATLLCCLPAGIAAIVFSVQANSAKNAGNFDEARRKAGQAKTWLYVSVGVGLVVGLLYLFAIIGGMAGEL